MLSYELSNSSLHAMLTLWQDVKLLTCLFVRLFVCLFSFFIYRTL